MDDQTLGETNSHPDRPAGTVNNITDNTLQPAEAILATSEEESNVLAMGLGTPRPVKHRPTFTEDQVASMERIFSQRQYLSPMERESLAGTVGLSPQQVRVWFQNRRQKVKQFLIQRQLRNGQSPVTGLQNGQKQGTSDATISLTAQQLTSNIDPILQMLLPKTVENGEELKEEEAPVDKTDDSKEPSTLIEGGGEADESLTTSSINLSPSQVSLTPYLLPLSGITPTIQLTGAQGGGANITIPAIQLLQSLLTATSNLPLAKVTKPTAAQSPNKAQSIGLSIPLKAQSPTQVGEIDEGTEIKSEEAATISQSSAATPPPADTLDTKLVPPEQSPLQSDANPVLTAVSSEILQQLLGLTGGDSLKATWNLSVSPNPAGVGSASNLSLDVPRRKRQVFSGVQTTELEKQFEICPYIDSKERDKLAEKIGLQPDQVKVWFQNRRTKRSRQSWRQQKSNSSEQ